MDLLDRVKAILLTPTSEWLAIAREADTAASVIVRYVAVLAVVPPVARFIGTSLIGGYVPISASALGALAIYLASFAIVLAVAFIIDMLAPLFGAQKNFGAALRLAAYSHTPVWLAGIFMILPGLSFLMLLGLYGAYLLRAGLPALMKAPAEKTASYAAVVVGCALLLIVGIGTLVPPLFAASSS